MHKTLHSERSKPYTASIQNPTQRAFKTLHSERSGPYTTSVRETIHEAEHKPYILFLNTNLANGTNEREWIVRNERDVRDECNERNERDERNVRNERDERNVRNERDERKTGNGNRRWTTFSTPKAFFRF